MMRKVVLLAAFAALLSCLATASTVTFSTTGSFSWTTLTQPFPSLTFTGEPSTTVTATAPLGDDVIFGQFFLGPCPTKTCTGTETFTLTITQTSPTSGSGPLIGTLTGTVTKKAGVVSLTFTTATETIGTTTYSIPVPSETINFKNKTTLNGFALSPVPEPNAKRLLSLGMLGLVGLTLLSRRLITT